MILTVTMNASVDITYVMEHFLINETNRVQNIKKNAGGKGINVTRVLNQVGAKVLASGVIAGSTGQFIEQQLAEQGIPQEFYKAKGESRNNISIIQGGNQTEILESGPVLSLDDLSGYRSLFERLLGQADTIAISGSLPRGVPDDYYAQLIAAANRNGKKVLLDASGSTLEASLRGASKPLLIKPNRNELADLLQKEIDLDNIEGLKQDLCSEQFAGIEWIVLSLGPAGALIKKQNRFYRAVVPDVRVINPIGSGDSVIAGLAQGIDRADTTKEIITRGMTFGVLNAMEERPGFLNLAAREEVSRAVKITDIS